MVSNSHSSVFSNSAHHLLFFRKQLSIPQKRAYIDAVLCLASKPAISGIKGAVNRFDDFQAVHSSQTPDIHWVGHFTLWHRYFVYTYEKALREGTCSL